MKIILTLLTFILIISDNKNVDKLKVRKIPSKEDIRKYNSKKPYKVVNSINGVKYELTDIKWNGATEFNFEIKVDEENKTYFSRPTNSIKVHNGWLIGFDRGEWSGALYWYNNDGTEKYLIKDRNVRDIIRFNNKVFITQGLTHLGGDFGSISEITYKDDKWIEEKTSMLSGKPYKTVVADNKLISITTENIILINSDMESEVLFEEGFWRTLYPNSIACYKGLYYFGMRGGILELNAENGSKNWRTK